MDNLIAVPQGMSRHDVHRLAYSFADGRKVLWSDEGNFIRWRPCDLEIDPNQFQVGAQRLIMLKANVNTSRGLRRDMHGCTPELFAKRWLSLRSEKMGFSVKSSHVCIRSVPQFGRVGFFHLGVTHFSCLIEITDPQRFAKTLQHGVPKTAHTYGMGMVVLY